MATITKIRNKYVRIYQVLNITIIYMNNRSIKNVLLKFVLL